MKKSILIDLLNLNVVYNKDEKELKELLELSEDDALFVLKYKSRESYLFIKDKNSYPKSIFKHIIKLLEKSNDIERANMLFKLFTNKNIRNSKCFCDIIKSFEDINNAKKEEYFCKLVSNYDLINSVYFKVAIEFFMKLDSGFDEYIKIATNRNLINSKNDNYVYTIANLNKAKSTNISKHLEKLLSRKNFISSEQYRNIFDFVIDIDCDEYFNILDRFFLYANCNVINSTDILFVLKKLILLKNASYVEAYSRAINIYGSVSIKTYENMLEKSLEHQESIEEFQEYISVLINKNLKKKAERNKILNDIDSNLSKHPRILEKYVGLVLNQELIGSKYFNVPNLDIIKKLALKYEALTTQDETKSKEFIEMFNIVCAILGDANLINSNYYCYMLDRLGKVETFEDLVKIRKVATNKNLLKSYHYIEFIDLILEHENSVAFEFIYNDLVNNCELLFDDEFILHCKIIYFLSTKERIQMYYRLINKIYLLENRKFELFNLIIYGIESSLLYDESTINEVFKIIDEYLDNILNSLDKKDIHEVIKENINSKKVINVLSKTDDYDKVLECFNDDEDITPSSFVKEIGSLK